MHTYWFLFILSRAIAANPYEKALQRYNADANQPLKDLSGHQLKELQNGNVVVTMDKSDRGWRASGLIAIKKSKKEIWVASRDQCRSQQKSTFEYVVDDYGGGSEDWYGLIELPWPLQNRHWMIRTKPNLKLARKTQDRIWERYWNLVDKAESKIQTKRKEGELPAHAKEAIFTPENAGAWFVIAIDSKTTILGYQVTTSVGGVIPDKVMMQFVSTTIDEMLIDMRGKTESIKDHYISPHTILFGGDGKPISYFE